ncbi:MAG: ThuA domain-containing protein [Armatimonadetes bacterium]|nr:ThuA domain-containing protein [Armatimonadota bacterium]
MLRMCKLALLLACTTAATAAPPLPLKVLVFGHSAGFVHASVKDMERVLPELGGQTGLFTATVSEDCADLNAANLAQYQVVVFFTSGNLPIDDTQRQAFLDWVKAGGGFLGVHSASDCNYNWPAYGELVGGYFDGHPWTQKVRIKVEDPDSPAAEGLGTSFEIDDEIYQQRNWDRFKVHVVLSLDNASIDTQANGVHRKDLDFGIAWCRDWGQGRSFYHALGHRPEVWANPVFQRQLLGAIKWLAKLDWRSDPEIQDLIKKGDLAGLSALVQARPEVIRCEPVAAIGALDTDKAAARLAELTAADQPADVRLAATKALGACTAGGVRRLTELAGDGTEAVRTAAVQALGKRGSPEAEVALVKLAGAAGPVRAAAVEALGAYTDKTARTALLDALKGPDGALQAAALHGLPDATDETVAATLLALLKARDPDHGLVLPDIATRLKLKARDDDVFEALRQAVDFGSEPLKAAAMQAIAGSGRPGLETVVVPWLFKWDGEIANVAARTIARIPGLDATDYLSSFVPSWLVCGPFDSPNWTGFDKEYPPETDQDMAGPYPGKGGEARWQIAATAPTGIFNFLPLYEGRNTEVVAYAYTEIRTPADVDCQLRLGSDDGAKVWLNGEVILNKNVPRGIAVDDDRVPVHLKAGANPLLCKITNGGGGWDLSVRLSRPDGGLRNVTFEFPRDKFVTPYIRRWAVCGPFPNDGHAGFAKAYPPEEAIDVMAEYQGAGGRVGWRACDANDGLLDLRALCPNQPENGAAYAYVTIVSPAERDCELWLGCDDGVRMWLNGKELLSKDVDRSLTRDEDKVPVHLLAGDNKLLVKVLQQGGDWSLAVRLNGQQGGMDKLIFKLPEGL